MLAHTINRILSLFGLVVRQTRKLPNYSLLGLKNIPIKCILDIGANEGQFAAWIKTHFPAAAIFSFEPVPETFEKLGRVALGAQNWSIYNLAVGSSSGEVSINYHSDHSSSSSILKTTSLEEKLFPSTKSQVPIKVSCVRLDDWCTDNAHDVEFPLLIKMDVQGYEAQVLAGGMSAFSKAEIVITEVIIQNLYGGQATFADLCAKFASIGLGFYGVLEHGLDHSGNVISVDVIFVRSLPPLQGIALPR